MRRLLPPMTLLALALMLVALVLSPRTPVTAPTAAAPSVAAPTPAAPAAPPLPGEPLQHRMVVTQKTLPPFEEMKSANTYFRLATSAVQYQEFWALYRLEGSPYMVDWEEEAVLFIGTGESGSCPMRLTGMAVDREAGLITVGVMDAPVVPPNAVPSMQYACTDDYTPRTFVVGVSAEELPAGMLRAVLSGAFQDTAQALRDEGVATPAAPGWEWVVHEKAPAEAGSIGKIEVLTQGDGLTVQISLAGKTAMPLYNVDGVRFNDQPIGEAWANRATSASDHVVLAFPGRLGLEPGAAAQVPFQHAVLKSVAVTEDQERGMVLFQVETHRKVGPEGWYSSYDQNTAGVILR